jgi:hypothetical protein
MSDEQRVRELFAARVARPVDLDGDEFTTNRERGIDTILHSAGKVPAKRRLLVWGSVGSALALAASLALLWDHFPSRQASNARLTATRPLASAVTLQEVRGTVSRWEGGRRIPLSRDRGAQAVPIASELVTEASSSLHVRSGGGLDIELFESSRLSLLGLGQTSKSVSLLAGSIRCDVPHLRDGQQFSVQTPQGSVIVHGTVFSVFVSALAEGARTCVNVEQGEVLVRTATGATRVGAGQAWGCEREARPAASFTAELVPLTTSVRPFRGTPHPKQDRSLPGTLDEENRLFQAALAAERRRDLALARATFDELLTKYPASPVAGEARAARERVAKELSGEP